MLLIFSLLMLFVYIFVIENFLKDKFRKFALIMPLVIGIGLYTYSLTYFNKDVVNADILKMWLLIFLSSLSISYGITFNLLNIIRIMIDDDLKCLTFKTLAIVLPLIILPTMTISIYRRVYPNDISSKIYHDIGVKLPKDINGYYKDTHGGFHGDGTTYFKASVTEEDIGYILRESQTKLNKMPLPKPMKDFIFDEDKMVDDFKFRYFKNGYWTYLNRQNAGIGDGNEIGFKSSYNYSFFLIDMDNHLIYYYKLDT